MTIHYSDDVVTLHHGDALDVVTAFPDHSVDCVVTSPPYFGLRDYGQDGQYGLESSPAEYVETMSRLFSEVRRVLADDGTFWLNIGDSYSTHQRGSDKGWDKSRLSNPGQVQKMQFAAMRQGRAVDFDRTTKNLLGIPWRLAFALQDDGWTLRNAIIWNKPNAMPESVTDRLACRYEHVFLFSKSRSYWFDLNPIREDRSESTVDRYRYAFKANGNPASSTEHLAAGGMMDGINPAGRNPGDVWTIPTQPFPGAHFAVMPVALAERCVLAGCKPGGVVLDPFSGSGTTGLAATKHGRRYVGVDLSAEYLDMSLATRLLNAGLPFNDGAIA